MRELIGACNITNRINIRVIGLQILVGCYRAFRVQSNTEFLSAKPGGIGFAPNCDNDFVKGNLDCFAISFTCLLYTSDAADE